jgi:flagellin
MDVTCCPRREESLIINHNINLMLISGRMNSRTKQKGKIMESLSSGMRINKGADDASGLAISEKMRAQIRGIRQGLRNVQDGISMFQTAEGGLTEIANIIQRIRELGVQTANSTLTGGDREAIQSEFLQLKEEINNIAGNTKFNTIPLLGKEELPEPETEITNNPVGRIEKITLDSGIPMYYLKVPVGDTAEESMNNLINGVNEAKNKIIGSEETQNIFNSYELQYSNNKLTINNEKGIFADKPHTSGWDTDIFSHSNWESEGYTINVLDNPKNGTEINDNFYTMDIIVRFVFERRDNDTGKDAAPNPVDIKTLQAGANANDAFHFVFNEFRTTTLGIEDINLKDKEKSTENFHKIDQALEIVNEERSRLGAYQNRLEHRIRSLEINEENLSAAESRIRDQDMAKAMLAVTKVNILEQAAQSLYIQANQQAQAVLRLLSPQ